MSSQSLSKCVFVPLALECFGNESFVAAGFFFFMLINPRPIHTHTGSDWLRRVCLVVWSVLRACRLGSHWPPALVVCKLNY